MRERERDSKRVVLSEHTQDQSLIYMYKILWIWTFIEVHIPSICLRTVCDGNLIIVRNAKVVLCLIQFALQIVHTGDGQHKLGRVHPHL